MQYSAYIPFFQLVVSNSSLTRLLRLSLAVCTLSPFCAVNAALADAPAPAPPLERLTYDAAYAIVRAEEEKKERVLDERYESVLNHPDNLSTSEEIDADGNRIIHIRMRPMERPPTPPAKKPAVPLSAEDIAWLKARAGKPMVNVSFSGEVDARGISELWWTDDGVPHRVFTNANFLYFTGSGNFENATHRYSLFLMISKRSPQADAEGVWRPEPDDYNDDRIEYFAVEPEDPEAADYSTLEAMLAHYTQESADMQTLYENRQLLSRARKDYLEAYPPKKRPHIFNPRPVYEKGDPRLH